MTLIPLQATTGRIYVNPAQVVSVERFGRGACKATLEGGRELFMAMEVEELRKVLSAPPQPN